MRTPLVLAGAALLLVSGPAFSQVNTGDRNNVPLKLNVKPTPNGTGVKARGTVLKTKRGDTRTSVAGTRTSASVLGGRNANTSSLAAARTKTSVLKTRSGDRKTSLVNPKLGVKVLPARNGPVAVRTGKSTPLAATAISPPKSGGKR